MQNDRTQTLAKKSLASAYATRCASAIDLRKTSIQFPSEYAGEGLNNHDYLSYLCLVQQKLTESRLNLNFNELIFTCYDATSAIDGLMAYQAQTTTFPCQTIILQFGKTLDQTEINEFLEQVKRLLSTLSAQPSPTLHLNITGLSSANIDSLITYIKENDKIAIDLILPEPFQTQSQQQTLDSLLSDRVRQQNIQQAALLQTSMVNDDSPIEVEHQPTPGEIFIATDNELQQENEAELELNTEREEEETATGIEKPIYYTIETFPAALREGKFGKYANSHWLDSHEDAAIARWCNWIGAFNKADALQADVHISKEACEALMHFDDEFQDGFDFTNPSAGFSVKTLAVKTEIDFSASVKRVT